MAKTTKVNYTPEQESELLAGYDPQDTQEQRNEQVNALVAATGRKRASIVSKLSNMGVYVKNVHATKDGGKVISKDDRVDALAAKMGILPELFTSLSKANVSVIKAIDEAISECMAARADMNRAFSEGFDFEEKEETDS